MILAFGTWVTAGIPRSAWQRICNSPQLSRTPIWSNTSAGHPTSITLLLAAGTWILMDYSKYQVGRDWELISTRTRLKSTSPTRGHFSLYERDWNKGPLWRIARHCRELPLP